MTDLGFELPEAATVSRKKVWWIALAALVVFGLALAVGILPRMRAHRQLEANVARMAEARATPRVELVKPKLISSDHDLVLPGDVEPLEQTIIYARASGYLKRWLVDLGAHVEEGQLLAEIDTPELDAQLEQAKAQAAQAAADVVRAEANREFSRSNVDRYRRLTPAGVSSQQDLDRQIAQSQVDEANVTVARATVNAQEANVRRLLQLKSFARVTAPFAGSIVSRTAERGTLVNAGGSPLFKLAAIDTVRVIIQVPQDVSPGLAPGLPAKVSIREFPQDTFSGKVTRVAGALDDATRTMNIEVWVQNPDHRLLAGMYASVALSLPVPHQLWEVPVTALYSDARGTRVAVVGPDHRASMRPITIERDTGQTLQISRGLEGSEAIVKLANAQVTEGTLVEEIQPEAKPSP
ncbi:MAG: efflux RND transporter periplasmic adaptor subunit [Myxococcota bacterium]